MKGDISTKRISLFLFSGSVLIFSLAWSLQPIEISEKIYWPSWAILVTSNDALVLLMYTFENESADAWE